MNEWIKVAEFEYRPTHLAEYQKLKLLCEIRAAEERLEIQLGGDGPQETPEEEQ